MPFMKPEIVPGPFYRVDTTDGTEVVACDDAGLYHDTTAEDLSGLTTGIILDKSEMLHVQTGYLARMSAPGYLDCTDWTGHPSERDARLYLADMYGDDDDPFGVLDEDE